MKYSWDKYPEFQPVSHTASSPVSVVVAFRNESANLEKLLQALQKQAYPGELYEVILVDDDSDDGSDIIVKHYCERNENFRYINNAGNRPGKKSAIRTGINHALHEFIVTTDADCIMGEYWLETLSCFYREKLPDMIIGLVDLKTGNGFFEKFEEADFLSLIASGAASAAGGRPVYCNAANFAFRKSIFFVMDDPLRDSIVSGDDTFFLHAAKKANKRILLLKSARSTVTTFGHQSFPEYCNQRVRWISKSRSFRDTDTLYTAALVLTMNVLVVASLVLLIVSKNFWLFPLNLIIKASLDYFFLQRFMLFMGKRLSAIRFFCYSALYPLNIMALAVTGMIRGYSWKGRHFGKGRKI